MVAGLRLLEVLCLKLDTVSSAKYWYNPGNVPTLGKLVDLAI